MREYSEEKMSSYLKTLQNAADSVSSVDYMSSIKNQYVLDKRYYIKNQAYVTSNQAYNRVVYIRKRLDDLYDIMAGFKRDVDAKTEEIYAITEKLLSLIEENNRALTSICDVLRGVGDFKGKVATPSSLASIGFDEAKNSALHNEVWDLLFGKFFDADSLPSEENINAYLESLKKKVANGVDLTETERQNLLNLYNAFVKDRFGATGDIRDMSMLAVQNGIDVFELLYPDAKNITDSFFSDAMRLGDETVQKNILRIKYTIYTAPPEYRDTMLHYLPEIGFMSFTKDKDGDRFSCFLNGVYVEIDKDFDVKTNNVYNEGCPFGAFFHELGHAIDDVSVPFSFSSVGLASYLQSDFVDSLNKSLCDYNASVPEKDRISSDEMKELVDYMMGRDNPNVCDDKTDPLAQRFLPSKWSPEQIKAYQFLRDTYGYCGWYLDGSDTKTKTISAGKTGGDFTRTLVSDIIGGLTNNKIGHVRSGHGLDCSKDKSKTPEELTSSLKKFNYWKSKGNLEKEFFAEAFNFGVLGSDTKPSKEIFGSAYKEYDNKISKIYGKVPHIEL